MICEMRTVLVRFILASLFFAVVANDKSVASAENRNTKIELTYGLEVIGVKLEASHDGEGVICVGGLGRCKPVKVVDGIGIVKIDFRAGDIVVFQGDGALKGTSIMGSAPVAKGPQWLEKVLLVLVGGLLGLFSNALFSLLQNFWKDRQDQKEGLRKWRDESFEKVKSRRETGDGDLASPRPRGMSRKNVQRIIDAEQSLRTIQSEMSIAPARSLELCDKAEKVLLSFKS